MTKIELASNKEFHRFLYSLQLNPIEIGPRLWGCPFCSVTFDHRKNMERHIMIHTGEKPFQCQFCDYSANRKYSLTSHMRWKHRDEMSRAE